MKKNNPFNIRKVANNKWLGKLPSSGSFERFRSVKYGVRAFIVLISTYRYKYGIIHLDDIITRYAPPSENDTTAYINYVSRQMKVHPSTEIDCNNLFDFAKAVAFFESNFKLERDIFEQALKLINR